MGSWLLDRGADCRSHCRRGSGRPVSSIAPVASIAALSIDIQPRATAATMARVITVAVAARWRRWM